jgi:hypothetical protein
MCVVMMQGPLAVQCRALYCGRWSCKGVLSLSELRTVLELFRVGISDLSLVSVLRFLGSSVLSVQTTTERTSTRSSPRFRTFPIIHFLPQFHNLIPTRSAIRLRLTQGYYSWLLTHFTHLNTCRAGRIILRNAASTKP